MEEDANGNAERPIMPVKGKKKDDSSKKQKPSPGDLMKAIIRPGEGDGTPKKGDQLILHYTTRTSQGVVVESTRLELGGRGVPQKFVMGKSKMIKGWEEGIPTMTKAEIAMFKVKPELHYADKDCPVVVPEEFPKNEELVFEIELIDFFPVKVIADDLGVLKRVLIEGEGWETPRQPYEVKVWLSWRTSNDIDFTPLQGNEPFHFTFGKEEVPAGLESGIGTMTRREKSIIYVSGAHLTKGSLIPNLPVEAEEIHFNVEVVKIIQVRDLVGDGRVIKRRIQDGRGEFPMDCPLQDSVMRIHYKGFLPDCENMVFYDSRRDHSDGEPITFGSDEGLVPEGLEMCVKLMLPGEIALVTSTSEYAYDKFPRPNLVHEGAAVQWEVELIDFEKAKDWTGLTFDEIMEEVESIKAIGNRLYKEGKYILAKAKYEKILRDFNHVNPQDDEEGKTFIQTRYLLNLNVAACYQKLGEHIKSIESCNKVLDENPQHVKALYRRGMSHMAVGDFSEARTDFTTMMSFDESAAADAKAALLKLKRNEQEAEAKARKQFKGLFDKKPGELSQHEEMNGNRDIVETGNSAELDSDSEKPSSTLSSSSLNPKTARMDQMPNLWNRWRNSFGSLFLRRCAIL